MTLGHDRSSAFVEACKFSVYSAPVKRGPEPKQIGPSGLL